MNEQIRKIFREYGKKGGAKTARLHGKEHYRDMQKKSVKARKKACG